MFLCIMNKSHHALRIYTLFLFLLMCLTFNLKKYFGIIILLINDIFGLIGANLIENFIEDYEIELAELKRFFFRH